MPELTFEEIKDWSQFEELVAAFFRSLKNTGGTNITDVDVKPSGIGADGGKDILVDFYVSDYIRQFKRTWVVQCKFIEEAVSPSKLIGVDIPTLVHSHNACGYLLVCKNRPSAGVTELFTRLNNQTTHFKYEYLIWSGEEFREKLLLATPIIHQQFFPKYFRELNILANKAEK